MKREEILKTIADLAKSQGRYGRMLEELREAEQESPEEFEECMTMLEKQNFKNPVDLVMYIEG